MHGCHTRHLKIINNFSPDCSRMVNLLFITCHFIANMRARIYDILIMMFGDGFFTCCYSSKVIKVNFFHHNTHCLFEFTSCSQPRGQRSEHILVRNPITTANNHRNYIVLYGESFYDGLLRGITEKWPNCLCDYMAVISPSLTSGCCGASAFTNAIFRRIQVVKASVPKCAIIY